MMLIDIIILTFSTLVLLGQIFIVLSILTLTKKKLKIKEYIRKNNLNFAFAVALASTVGSLFFEFAAGFTPCELCWFQRIFMYPLVIILGVAVIEKDFKVKMYAVPLATIGVLFSIYHYSTQVFNTPAFCSAETAVSCTTQYFLGFGYISISLMALTAFAMIITLFTIYDKK